MTLIAETQRPCHSLLSTGNLSHHWSLSKGFENKIITLTDITQFLIVLLSYFASCPSLISINQVYESYSVHDFQSRFCSNWKKQILLPQPSFNHSVLFPYSPLSTTISIMSFQAAASGLQNPRDCSRVITKLLLSLNQPPLFPHISLHNS